MLIVVFQGPVQAQGTKLRAVERGAARAARTRMLRILERDWIRDSKLAVTKLRADRTVFRYVGRGQAKEDLLKGIKVGSHTTATAGRGRPLGARAAQRRFGLPDRPVFRETIDLTRSMRVRIGRALGGSRGVGEITLRQRATPKAIRRVTPLK